MVQGSKIIWDARPRYSDPKLPQEKTALRGRSGTCGSYWDEVEIRYPYDGTDIFSETLPRLVSVDMHSELEGKDSSGAALMVRAWVEKGLAHDVIANAESMYGKYSDIIGPANRKFVKSHIETAWKHAKNAMNLWKWWENVYVPVRTPLKAKVYEEYVDHSNPFKTKTRSVMYATSTIAPHFPLGGLSGDTYAFRCFDPYMVYPDRFNYEYDGYSYLVNCPEGYEFAAHDADAALYCKLVIAATVHARCASEVAATVGVYMMNKAKSRKFDKKPTMKWGGV